MKKRAAAVFVLLIVISGYAYAENEENIPPKNIVTVDTGLTLYTLIIGMMENGFFGTALQYERQIIENASIAGRIEYKGFFASDSRSTTIMQSFSAEGHGRYYPEKKFFFLDGMLGYAFFNYSHNMDQHINTMSHYFKLGGKLGWRIDFGKPGGFVLEPSFGYYGAIGKTNISFIEGEDAISIFFDQLLFQLHDAIIKGFFVGGMQISLGMGYSF